MEIKTNINKWDLIKLKSLYTAKKTINKMKRQPSDWEKIFANKAMDKGIISKIHKQLMQFNKKKKQKNHQPRQKMDTNQNQHFSKDDIQIANKHMKRCSASLITREMQIKTTMKYHLKPVRMATTKKSTNNKCRRGCGGKGTLLHCWWECKLV